MERNVIVLLVIVFAIACGVLYLAATKQRAVTPEVVAPTVVEETAPAPAPVVAEPVKQEPLNSALDVTIQ